MAQKRWRESTKDLNGDTYLHFAAALGNYQQLLHYLTLNCNINAQNNFGWTPLMQAARKGHTDCVKLLLTFGADVAIKNRFVASGDLKTVSLIVKANFSRGISICEVEQYFSPVFFAVLYNHIDILRYLEKYKYSLTNTVPLGDFSPVVVAKILKHKEIEGLFKRRGIMAMNYYSPLLKIHKSTPSNQTSILSPYVPIFMFNSPAVPQTPCNTPKSASYLNPLPVSLRQLRKRKSSNFVCSPPSETPNLSPIVSIDEITESPNLDKSFYDISRNSSNHMLNSRIKLRFSSTDDSNDSAFFLSISQHRNAKQRSASCNAAETFDEVFLPYSIEYSNTKNEFMELLRRNSLDSCIHLFEKHEIDMDLFLTLSKSDLEEIGVDWDKRDEVLELIYQCNKNRYRN